MSEHGYKQTNKFALMLQINMFGYFFWFHFDTIISAKYKEYGMCWIEKLDSSIVWLLIFTP